MACFHLGVISLVWCWKLCFCLSRLQESFALTRKVMIFPVFSLTTYWLYDEKEGHLFSVLAVCTKMGLHGDTYLPQFPHSSQRSLPSIHRLEQVMFFGMSIRRALFILWSTSPYLRNHSAQDHISLGSAPFICQILLIYLGYIFISHLLRLNLLP